MTSTMSGLKACISEMPAALMAVSSELSPRFPKTISELSRMASHDVERETFTYQLVDISPQELHHQHKLADEERSHEKQSELLGDKDV